MSADRVDVRYVLDQAEIPTFQERGLLATRRPRAQARRGAASGSSLTVDGRRVVLRARRRAALAPARPGRADDHPRRAAADRAGARRRATCASTTARSRAASAGRRSWPCPGAGPRCARRARRPTRPAACAATRATCSKSPTDLRVARRWPCAAGAGTVAAPDGPRRSRRGERLGDGFTGSARTRGGRASCCSCCAAAFGWGAVHALSPGHGKTMVAAYLVGTRGTARARAGARRRP